MHDARSNDEPDKHVLAIRDANSLCGYDAADVKILRQSVVELGKGLSGTRAIRESLQFCFNLVFYYLRSTYNISLDFVGACVLREAAGVTGGEESGAVDANGREPQIRRAMAPRVALVHQSEGPAQNNYFYFLKDYSWLNSLLSEDGGAVHYVVRAADEYENYFGGHVEHSGNHVPEQNESWSRLEFRYHDSRDQEAQSHR